MIRRVGEGDASVVEDDDIIRKRKGEFHILLDSGIDWAHADTARWFHASRYHDGPAMKRIMLILAFIPAGVFAQGKEYYGAIAYSLGSGAHGWASNHPSRTAAEKAALSHCRKHAKDCKVQVWFVNACGALAVGADGFGTAWGNPQKAADDEAFKLCAKHSKACAVVRRVCSDGKG